MDVQVRFEFFVILVLELAREFLGLDANNLIVCQIFRESGWFQILDIADAYLEF